MTGAREEILASIRAALRDSPRADAEVPRGYRDVPAPAELVELFAERVADYRATVTRCARAGVAEAIRAALGDARPVVVPGGLPYPVDGARAGDGLSASELDTVAAVVTTAAVGIAITGTIVLDHGPGQGHRALSLVPDRHVCVLHTDQIVTGVPGRRRPA